MARTHNNKDVDFDKLKREFVKRGWNASQASLYIGKQQGYFASMKQKGYLPQSTLLLLDSIFNIKYEDIKPENKVPTKEAAEKIEESAAPITLTKEELRFIITEAVKDAFIWYANR